MKPNCLLRLAFVLCLLPFAAAGQGSEGLRFENLSTENFKVEKGLSQNSINCIWQDYLGYMWFGTWDGLNQYDGYRFKVFKSSTEADPSAICHQTVKTLFEDSRHHLWIGTETGLNRFIPATQQFEAYRADKRYSHTLSSDSIKCITEDSDGYIWIGTGNGLNRMNPATGRCIHYFLDPNSANSLSSNNILSLVSDRKGTLFVGTDRGLNLMNIRTGHISHLYCVPGDPLSLSDDFVNVLMLDGQGQVWIGTSNGLDVYHYRNSTIRHYVHHPGKNTSLSMNNVTALLKDRSGTIWVGTYGGGLNLYRAASDDFLRFQHNPNVSTSISNDFISALFQDRSGIIWVGTAWKGVNKILLNYGKFQHYEHIRENPKSISNNIIWSIFQAANGAIYLGTEDGVNALDRVNDRIKFFRHAPDNPNSLPSNQIRSVFCDSRGMWWLGTFGQGVDRYNPFTKTHTHFRNDPLNQASLSNNTVWRIMEDRRGNIWFATHNGLSCYSYSTAKFKVYRHIPNYKYSISGNYILWITEDRLGMIWISTYDGLNVFNPATGRFHSYHHDPANPSSLSSDYVFGVLEARNGLLWVGTMGGGLNRFDRKTGVFRHYTEKDGLANNVVYNIFEDKAGKLWMTTNSGISRFDPVTEEFVNYDVKDGLQGNEFNLGAAFHNKLTDEIFVGGMSGFNAFVPSSIKTNSYIPPIVISAFRIFDKLQPRELTDGDTLRLRYSDNFFSFEFSALDFTNPAKNHYAYILERFDKEWTYTDAYKRFASYTNVTPGTYVFRVKGTNSDGVWNDEGISVIIIISPAWWTTWWFRSLVAVVGVFLLWYIVYMRWRNIRIKHEDEKRILEIEKQMFSLEQTALRLQINPHFIFNSLNSIQSFVIANDTDLAINYLAKFAQLMRLILSNSHLSFIPVTDELKALHYYLDIERLRFDNKFDYEFVIDPVIDADFTEVPPMIIQPFVENAILHGILNKKGKGKITVSMKKVEDSIKCTVEDDGIGRDAANEIKARSDLQHKSRGMLITMKRLELLNKQSEGQMSVNIIDLKNEAGEACGTRVEIYIRYREF